jgi:glycosyltransferase involved in cell wall biosynthesis
MLNSSISVIIPVRNEEKFIKRCIERLANQTYEKKDIEVLVVDGMSEDGTREIIHRISRFLANNYRMKIRLIDNPKGQRAAALNIGIKEASGDIILRIDAKTIIPPDYIEKCVKTLIEKAADNVGGIQKPVIDLESGTTDRDRTTQMAICIALSHPFGVGNARFRVGKKSGFVDTVYLGCFRREVFDKVGLFDEESVVISEDSDMNYRIKRAGGKVYFNKDIIAYYYPRDNYKDLWKLYFRYGGAKAGNLIKRGRLTAWRQFIPPFFLLSLILFPFLGMLYSGLFFYIWAFEIGCYFNIDFIISGYMASISKPSYYCLEEQKEQINHCWLSRSSLFWRLFFVFPTIHFSWALGFWRRLLQRPKPGEYWGN